MLWRNFLSPEFRKKFKRELLLHTFNGPFSGTAQVSRYQKGKTNLDFTEARVAVVSAEPYASLHLAPDR